MYTCGRHTSTQWTFLFCFFVLFFFLRKEKKNQYKRWPLGQTSVSQLHRGPSLPPHLLSVRRDERIWYKNRWRNANLFPPFAPCFKCSRHHGSDEKRRRECELGRERRDLIWLSALFLSLFFFFWLRGFSYPPFPSLCFPLPSVDPLCVRSVTSHRPTQSSFCVRTLSLWPTASMLASQTDGRTEGPSEWVRKSIYAQTNRKKKNKTAIWLWVTACCSKFIEMYTTKFLFV